MMRIADEVKGYTQQNPFSDSQARNFSDTKLISEFCPVSNYWSLFNDQHEVLLGTRGSGKTFLLKMMRYSMLKRIDNEQAREIAQKKEYIALYVPMYLEFVTHLTNSRTTEDKQIQLFQFAFNCLLAQSLLIEIKEILSEEEDKIQWAKKSRSLASDLNEIWFNEKPNGVSDLFSLTIKIEKLFYNFDLQTGDMSVIPPIFKRPIGASLLAAKDLIVYHLGLKEEPTWIICIDEAEFLSETLQRCINNVFRSDSKRIALKVATLPFYHSTLKTLDPNVSVSVGNDFNYRVVDMKYDDQDFCRLTDSLVAHRLKTRFKPDVTVERLEDFLGTIGSDAQIDYYREEVGAESSTYDAIIQEILKEFSEERRNTAADYEDKRKPVYDKFAPIFYIRKMYDLSKQGNTKPGWYAGSQMVRKIAQGNPRAFIQIMNNLFEKARHSVLTPKAQHGVLMEYAHSFCESTQALESNGPTMYRDLKTIAKVLHDNVHGDTLKMVGSNFVLKFDNDRSFTYAKKWLQQATAYSRITVAEDALKTGIKNDTEYALSNVYAAEYWIPMRSETTPKRISIRDNQVATYVIKLPRAQKTQDDQISFFEEDTE